jgi:N-acyl-D-amino-acid deacylase
MQSILIKNGLIVDGTKTEPFKGHVFVSGDRIKSVVSADTPDGEDLLKREADRTIDAEGLAVAPGFIDAHSHFDWLLPLSDHEFLFPMVEQGVTTVVTGNCGYSPAPVVRGNEDLVNEYAEFCLEKPLSYRWEGMGEFLDYLSSNDGMLFNNAQMVGHGTVHLAAVRDTTRLPSPDEMSRIVAMIDDSLDSGAFGLSLGLMYPPGIFYRSEDLATVIQAAAGRNRLLTVHKRALSRYSPTYPIIPFISRPHNLRALEEMLSLGLETGVKLQISHFIFVGKKSWKTAEKAVRMIERARERGLAVMWDIYPHFCGNSYLNVFLPAWFQEDLESNLKNPKAIKRVRFELNMAARLLGFEMSDIQIMQGGYPGGERYEGMNMAEISEREGIDPIATLIKLVEESDGKALQLTYGYSGDENNEWLIEGLMSHDLCLFETDTILKSSGFPNPASYGAFPRILGRFVRDKRVLSLSDAVSKMSGKTARWMGIAERGELQPGYFADIVIFNPDTIADNTSRRETARRPTGIEKVFINGEMVVDGGVYIKGRKVGRVLRCS